MLLLSAFGFSVARGAEAFRVTQENRSALPSGKEADGAIGDWIIRNDQVVAVIGATNEWRDANQMVEGVQGAVIDFTRREENNDQLVVLYPQGYRPTGVSANRAEVLSSSGKSASLVVVRDPSPAEPFRSTTTYTLRDGEDFLHIHTVHENPGVQPVEVAVHDWLRLDNDLTCAQAPEITPVVIMENAAFGTAYGLGAINGRTQRARQDLDRKNLRTIGTWVHYPAINPDQLAKVSLAPGAKLEYERRFFVARDFAGVQLAAARALDQSPTTTSFVLREPDGKPVEGASCVVRQGETFLTHALSDRAGLVRLPLTPGRYTLAIDQVGRKSTTRDITIGEKSAAESEVIALNAQSRVTLDIAEAGSGQRLPVKLEFRGRNQTPAPFLGTPKRATGANSLFYSAHGTDSFPVPAGDYTVVISRGAEYGVVHQELTVPATGSVTLKAELTREFSTPHWVIADFHSHSTASGDCTIEIAARVLNLAGAGIEFAPATEHNRIMSYTPTIRALGIEPFIASAASIELSGRPGPGNINHQIAFPLEMHEDQQGNGAPRTDVDPGVQMRRLYDLDGGSPKLMQQNHPDIGWLYHDKDRDGTLDGGFATRPITDVMEVREAIHRLLADTTPGNTERKSRAFYWLQMLNLGDRIYGTANTDSHNLSPVSGSLFNYVRVERDEIATLDPWDIARAAKAGHMVMSNGPFMEVTANHAMPGDSVAATGGKISLRVRVQQASWARIDRVQVLANGRQLPEANFTRAAQPERFGRGVTQFDQTIALILPADAHLIVVAAGEHDTMARITSGQFAKLSPIAVSNPIFVDVDGNGFKPSGDLLGEPLPDGKPRDGEKNSDND